MASQSTDKRQFGDFQTPLDLARKVVITLKRNHRIEPDFVIEPTCGRGAFLHATYENFGNARILGFEINSNHVTAARSSLRKISATDRATVTKADFFHKDWKKTLDHVGRFLLVIGNPPWVTNSAIGALGSGNLPVKSNFQNRSGIHAITGGGNFDISEWMLLQHVAWLKEREGAIAFLCKYAVARKIMRQVWRHSERRFSGYIYSLDTKTYFGVSVEACLFVLTTNTQGGGDCQVYDSLDSQSPSRMIGERYGYVVGDVARYGRWRHLEGQSSKYIWRSGIKHDCSKVMELEPTRDGYCNGLGEIIRCEDDYLYPLLKGSDVGNGRIRSHRKVALVTQRMVGEDTTKIMHSAPKTWRYLAAHKVYLDKRRSIIYKNKPDFAIFGVGDYTFKPWKIAISGFYKRLRFYLVGPSDGKAVVFDDTVNFLSFDTKAEATFVYRMVTSLPALEFLKAIVFWDEKRPITARLLRRLSINAVAKELGELSQYRRWNAVSSSVDRAVEIVQ